MQIVAVLELADGPGEEHQSAAAEPPAVPGQGQREEAQHHPQDEEEGDGGAEEARQVPQGESERLVQRGWQENREQGQGFSGPGEGH